MNKIKVLDTHLTNMIAAGEVVERPAGIIKELVENSLDANASHIQIRVNDGGMSLIEVSDNGEGMSGEDLRNAFKRHSTSKIHSQNDLIAIGSFGFRGEALPSIASVTQTRATSMHEGVGHFIEIDNGLETDFGRFARNQGTTISVSNLFLKTPARLKHIKNTRYESSIILDTVHKFALGNPHIAFTLINDDREVFRSLGKNDVIDVYARIYSGTVAKESLVYSESNYDFKIDGVMALPMHSRSNRNAIVLFINNRMIRFNKIQNAVINAYRRHMSSDRFPIVIMNISVDPQLVDVNVHPSKWEIRLSKEEVLVELILDRFEALLAQGMRPQRIKPKVKEIVEQTDFLKPLLDSQNEMLHQSLGIAKVIETSEIVETFFATSPIEEKEVTINHENPSLVHESELDEQPIDNEVINTELPSKKYSIEALKVLSQMSGKYILAQGDLGLYIIDQHAAMERIRYEYYQHQMLDKQTPTQVLLIPLMIEGRSHLVGRIEEINEFLAQFQLELEAFGDDTFILRELPLWIKEDELSEFINRVLDDFESNQFTDQESIRTDVLATLACHSSVRFNEYLSHEEMVQLVEDLRQCDQGYHCPHGRPTFVTFEHADLLKAFKR